MKKIAILVLMLSSVCGMADIQDPVSSLAMTAHLSAGQVVYRWGADVNGDGREVVFLDLKSDYNPQEKHDRNIPSWYVYIQNPDKSGYLSSRGTEIPELGAGVGPAAPKIDPEKMYIGFITQLGRRGIVTIQADFARNTSPVFYVFAYTIESDHLKETQLAQYDPTKGSSPIYDQYLSKEHRTEVQLQQVTIP